MEHSRLLGLVIPVACRKEKKAKMGPTPLVHQAQEVIQVPAILNPVLKETPVLMADQVHKAKLVKTV